LTPVFSAHPEPLIPLPFLFTTLGLALNFWEIALLTPTVFGRGSFVEVCSQYRLYAMPVAPVLSLLMRKNTAQIAWWSLSGFMSYIVWQTKKWMASGDQLIHGLEDLRYAAKGA
jgi:hypothetical protein